MLQILWIARFLRWLERIRVRRTTIQQLSMLPDYALKDIGIPRARIREVVDRMMAVQQAGTAAPDSSAEGRAHCPDSSPRADEQPAGCAARTARCS